MDLRNPYAKTLNLSRTKLTQKTVVEVLQERQADADKWETIDLSYCELDDKAFELVLSTLGAASNLRALYLGHNQISTAGMRKLAEHLPSFPNLELLNLRDNKLTHEGLFELIGGIKAHRKLSKLNVGHNPLGFSHHGPQDTNMPIVLNLRDLLKDPNCPLEHFNMSGCGIDVIGSKHLLTAVAANPRLKTLNLNSPNNQGVDKLEQRNTLGQNKQFYHLKYGTTRTKPTNLNEGVNAIHFYVRATKVSDALQNMATVLTGYHKGNADYQSEGRRIVNYRDERGRTPLYVAASMGRATMVRLLLQYNADVTLAKDGNVTPLDAAMKHLSKAVVSGDETSTRSYAQLAMLLLSRHGEAPYSEGLFRAMQECRHALRDALYAWAEGKYEQEIHVDHEPPYPIPKATAIILETLRPDTLFQKWVDTSTSVRQNVPGMFAGMVSKDKSEIRKGLERVQEGLPAVEETRLAALGNWIAGGK